MPKLKNPREKDVDMSIDVMDELAPLTNYETPQHDSTKEEPMVDAQPNGVSTQNEIVTTKIKTEEGAEPPKKKLRRRRKVPDAVKYHCNYCGVDISHVVRVKCAVCADFDLCVHCFAVGVEVGTHKRNHDYHVMDILNFPLFDEDWGADEELLLLEGIEMYGMGNWSDVADHVGTKNPMQCKDHYFGTYINVPTAPLPDMTHILTTSESLQLRNKLGQDVFEEEDEEDGAEEDKKKDGPKPTTSQKKLMTKDKEGLIPQGPNSYSIPELSGWMPLRGDFETEFVNEAEQILCEMQFGPEDTQEDRDLKLKVIEIYNKKLDERARRKKFILERNLLDYKKAEKKRSKEDKEIFDRVRVFARVMTKEEHEQFIQGLTVERQLRRRIEELKRYRKAGIRSSPEIEPFEKERRKREEDRSIVTRQKEAALNAPRANSLGLDKLSSSSSSLGGSTSSLGIASLSSSSGSSSLGFGGPRNTKWLNRDKDQKWLEASKKQRVRKPGTPLDISQAPGFDLLSDQERELCSQIRLFPHQYMVIKDTLLRESLKTGNLTKQVARTLVKIDVNKTGRIFDFFEAHGWVNNTKERSPSNSLPPIFHPEMLIMNNSSTASATTSNRTEEQPTEENSSSQQHVTGGGSGATANHQTPAAFT